MIKQTILTHRFYSSDITVNGWLVFEFNGPCHRHRAKKMVEQCELKALEIIEGETIKDSTNVHLNADYLLN